MQKPGLQVGFLATSLSDASSQEELKNSCCSAPPPLPEAAFMSPLEAMHMCLQSLPLDLPGKRGLRNTALLHTEKSKVPPTPPVLSLFSLLCPSTDEV